jgi:pyrroloquinoline quinone biosynthesis protein B
MKRGIWGVGLLLLLWGCSVAMHTAIQEVPVKATSPSTVTGPRVRILGIAQDGGLPHAACSCSNCSAARTDPSRASGVASLGIIAADKAYLVDASPDIIQQLATLSDVRTLEPNRVDRTPVDGVFLTHAHIGHYLGLALLGFEAVNTKELPVWCSQKMGEFLTQNAPWDRLISQKNLALNVEQSGEPVALPGGVQVTPIGVPHRAEYTDTYGYLMAGARQRVLYIPDTSPWHAWSHPMEEVLEGVDVALLDGTFYSGDELPGRDLTKIGHPLMVDTMDRLQSRVDSGTLRVIFVHLNHSNPALDPSSDARKTVEKRGFSIGGTGQEFAL